MYLLVWISFFLHLETSLVLNIKRMIGKSERRWDKREGEGMTRQGGKKHMTRPLFRPKWIRSKGTIQYVYSDNSLTHFISCTYAMNFTICQLLFNILGTHKWTKHAKNAECIEYTYSAFLTKSKMAVQSVLLVYSSDTYYCNKIIWPFGGIKLNLLQIRIIVKV